MLDSTPKLRAALIGCGFFAENHAHAWRMLPEVEVIAVCDSQPERCEVVAAILGNQPSMYSNATELLANERLDFVDICTRADTHEQLVTMAASAGLHVICQKPLAQDLASASRMLNAVQLAGVHHLVHENFRFQPAMRFAHEQLANIGQPFFARLSFRSGYDVYANQPYLLHEKHFIVMDVGVHLLDLARFFLGEIVEQDSHLQTVNSRIQGEDVATIMTRHAGGATAVVDISYASQPALECFPQTLLTLEGRLGTVDILPNYQVRVTVAHQTTLYDLAPIALDWFKPPMDVVQSSVLALQRHWVDCLRFGTAPEVGFDDNFKTLTAVFNCYELSS